MKMKHMVKSVRGGVLAIALSLAMVISIFAGTGMEVRAEGGYTLESASMNASNFTEVIDAQLLGGYDFDFEEADQIGNWLSTLELSNDTVCLVCLSDKIVFGVKAWANGQWLSFPRSDGSSSGYMGTSFTTIANYDNYYFVKRGSTSNTPSTTACSESPAPHTHSYSWVTVQEVTADQDGIEEYRCSCGDVQGRNVLPANMVFVKGLYGAIKDAPQGGTATFDSGRLYTISDYVIRKLAERTDVTTVITFEYQNQKYKMTIPAGVDYTSLLADEDYFYGYFYFANAVGATIETIA